MRMVNHTSKEINGKLVFTDIVVHIEHKDLEHPEREQDCCATCKSKFYPECTNSCGMLKED